MTGAGHSAVREWRPIATAPRDGTVIDVWADGRRAPNSKYRDGKWVSWAYAVRCVPRYHILNHPSHWMPLPDPPTNEGRHTLPGAAPDKPRDHWARKVRP